MSLEKLLFTHKPLARRITALRRNLIKLLSEGAGKIQKPLVFLHFSAFLIYSHSISRIYLVVSIRTYILYFVVYYLYYPCYSEYTFFCIKKCIKKEEVIHCRPTNTVALLAEQSFLYQRINSHCIRLGRLMLAALPTNHQVYRKQLGEPYNYLG